MGYLYDDHDNGRKINQDAARPPWPRTPGTM
jgi:hypothetical protein